MRRIDPSNVIRYNFNNTRRDTVWLCLDGGILKAIFNTELEALRYAYNEHQTYLRVKEVKLGAVDLTLTNDEQERLI